MKSKKKILIAFAMLLLTGAALTTASYAWFTANTRLQLGEIDVNVEATNGIQVSTDAEDWKSSLTLDEIKAATYTGSTTQFPDYDEEETNKKYFEPVSTDGSITDGKFNMFYGVLQADGSVTLTAEEEAEGRGGKFIAFDIFIRANESRQIGLLQTSGVTSTNALSDAGLKQLMRVGFINNGVDPTSTPATAQGLEGGTEYTIWEPNADQHITYAVGRGYANGNYYGYKGATQACVACEIDSAGNFTTIPAGTATTKNHLLTNTAGTHFSMNPAAYDTTFPTTTVWNASADTPSYPTIFNVAAGINKIRIYIWVEGQDADCENSATYGSAVAVTINLNAKPIA